MTLHVAHSPKVELAILGELERINGDMRLQFRATLKNIGNSPATNIQIWAAMCCAGSITSLPIDSAINKIPRPWKNSGFSLFPNDGVETDVWAGLLEDEIKLALKGATIANHIDMAVVVSTCYKFSGGVGETKKIYRIIGPGMFEATNLAKLPINKDNLRLEAAPSSDIVN